MGKECVQRMKPKVKPHVHYAPTEDGVYIRTWTQEFVIKGNSLAQWLDQLLPYLNGEQTLDELVAPLPAAQAQFVRSLVEELSKRGAVFDQEGVEPVELSEVAERLYRQTILFLEDRFVEGRQRFLALRQRPLAVAGAGLSFRACVRSLARMGIQELQLFPEQEDEVLQSFLAKWQERDPEFQVRHLDAENAELDVPLVYASDEAGGAARWAQRAQQAGVPFLAATVLGGLGVVGPANRPGSSATWSTVLDRFAGGNVPSIDVTPIQRTLVGNVAAMEVLRARSGLLDEQASDQVVLIEPTALAVTRHTLWPSPQQEKSLGEAQRQGRLAEFRSCQEAVSQVEFLANLERQADEQLGVLASLRPGDLWQIPMALGQAVVHVPTPSGVRPLTVIRGGEDLNEALESAARSAFLAYAKSMEGELEEATESVWAHGRTYDEWRGHGLLEACIQRVRAEEEVWYALPPLDPRMAVEAGLLKLLTVRYGLAVELYAQELPGFAHAVRVVHSRAVLSEGQGRTYREALRQALIEALTHLQKAEQIADETAASAEVLEESAIRRGEAPMVVMVEEPPAWSEWLMQAQAWVEESGLQVICSPWIRDRAVYEAGVLIGQVRVVERGEGG